LRKLAGLFEETQNGNPAQQFFEQKWDLKAMVVQEMLYACSQETISFRKLVVDANCKSEDGASSVVQICTKLFIPMIAKFCDMDAETLKASLQTVQTLVKATSSKSKSSEISAEESEVTSALSNWILKIIEPQEGKKPK
jgi:GTPase Era involved in 16S rRNA processing